MDACQGMDAWKDAGFSVDENSKLDEDSGLIFGTGNSGIEKLREAIYKIDDQQVRRLGSTLCSTNHGKWNISVFGWNFRDWEIKSLQTHLPVLLEPRLC